MVNQDNKRNKSKNSLLEQDRDETKIYGRKYQEEIETEDVKIGVYRNQSLASKFDQTMYLINDVNIFKYSDRMQHNSMKAW